jgi:hypothetical protein
MDDYGTKVFGSIHYPEIFGICGDVTFAATTVATLVQHIDSHLILDGTESENLKNQRIFEFIAMRLNSYPKSVLGNFEILHATRTGDTFHCFKISYTKKTGLRNGELHLPTYSTIVSSLGSGATEFDENFKVWETHKHNNHRTSRGVYHCFDKTLRTISDPQTGGRPQVIGLFNNKDSRIFGIIEGAKCYVLGLEYTLKPGGSAIEWRNANFERGDPYTKEILFDAQRQPQ